MKKWFRFFELDDQQRQIKVGCQEGDSGPIQVFSGASILDPGASMGRTVEIAAVRLLHPVAPSKLLCLWNNFHELAAKIGQPEPKEPLVFQKSANSFANPHDAIRKPISYDGKVVYEGELGIVIGKRCKDVNEQEAEAAIFGFTCVNDVTALDLINVDPTFQQWSRAKSCDGFAPFGPAVTVGLDWRNARVRTVVSGRERQNYPVADMIFSPPAIVRLISRELTLEPGDLISCGTSVGVLPMRPNTTVEVSIEGIGSLINTYEPAA
ncbi:MAG: fumarylacetoacetate hydrolase family protein [Burkholderiaceae bacterium]|nr:fumarylacetoacetate hydrolase family protein [Burkholderiaceae bacterium]